jgi:hypothetical protein
MTTTVLPFSEDDLTFWRNALERAQQLNTDTVSAWDVEGNLKRYMPKTVMTDTQAPNMDVNCAKDFADVQRKIAALFFATPTVALIPDAGTPPPPLLLHQELLNQILGPKRMNSKATAIAAIQDCLVALQPVPSEIGYTNVQVVMDRQVPVMDPMSGQPVVDPMTGQPQLQVQPTPMTVWEEFFWTKISPRAVLLPSEWRSTDYDDAPWIGYRWRKPQSEVRRHYSLTEDTPLADESQDLPYFQPLNGQNGPDNSEPQCTGAKFWYRASVRDPNVLHPLVIREVVLIDGMDRPVVHQNLTCQTIGPDGRLTDDSLVGYPLHPLALRDLTDAPYVAADCTITAPLTRELNKFRTQIIQRRDGSKLGVLVDSSRINPEVRQKIGQSDRPTMIPVEPGALDAGADKIMAQVPALNLGRESYLGQDYIERDRAQILGIDANQVGVSATSSRTATEITTVQRNADARFEQERARALEWWLAGVQKLSALILRYGDQVALDVLGPQRGQLWQQAKQQGIFGRYTFEIVVDSGNYTDVNERRRQTMQLYNMTAKDPATNHQELLLQIASEFGLDPSRWLVTKPPEQKPEPPTLSISVKPEDLDPRLPSYVGTYAILTAGGVKGLPPPVPQPMAAPLPPPAEHGGMSEQSEMLNKHQMDETGERSGPPAP